MENIDKISLMQLKLINLAIPHYFAKSQIIQKRGILGKIHMNTVSSKFDGESQQFIRYGNKSTNSLKNCIKNFK